MTGSQIPEIAPFDPFMRMVRSVHEMVLSAPEKQKARDVVVAGLRFPETGGG
jgi:hypothetical protein